MEHEHVSIEELMEYFAGDLGEESAGAIERHCAECLECTERARQVRALGALYDRWTPEAHGAAQLRAAVAQGLRAAQEREQNPAWRDRLREWLDRWGGKVEAGVRVVMEAPGKASRIVTEGLETIARPGGRWEFQLAPARILGPEGEVSAEPAIALAPGTPQARVAVSGETQEVVARVDDLPAGERSPLVVLVPMGRRGEAKVAEPRRAPGTGYLLARFEEVEPGEYLALFEPMEE